MTDPLKPKAVFTYCFQIWITGVLLGPVVFIIWHPEYYNEFGGWLVMEVIWGMYGAYFSIPALLLFSGGTAILFLRPWTAGIKRLILSFWGSLLIIASFGIFFGTPLATGMGELPGSISYLLPSFASVWIYRWPGRMK